MAQSVAEWWVRTRRIPRADLVDYLLALTRRGFDGFPRHPIQRQPKKTKA